MQRKLLSSYEIDSEKASTGGGDDLLPDDQT